MKYLNIASHSYTTVVHDVKSSYCLQYFIQVLWCSIYAAWMIYNFVVIVITVKNILCVHYLCHIDVYVKDGTKVYKSFT